MLFQAPLSLQNTVIVICVKRVLVTWLSAGWTFKQNNWHGRPAGPQNMSHRKPFGGDSV